MRANDETHQDGCIARVLNQSIFFSLDYSTPYDHLALTFSSIALPRTLHFFRPFFVLRQLSASPYIHTDL